MRDAEDRRLHGDLGAFCGIACSPGTAVKGIFAGKFLGDGIFAETATPGQDATTAGSAHRRASGFSF